MRRELTVWSNEWTVRRHPIFCASDTTRHVVHTSVRSPCPSFPLVGFVPLAVCPPHPLSISPPSQDQHSKNRGSFHPSSPRSLASRLSTHFFSDSIHITTNYTQPYGHPSLLAGLLNGYNLALFTTRAARSPVWQVSPRRSFLWEANRRRSLSSPASKSKIILSLGALTTTINPFERVL